MVRAHVATSDVTHSLTELLGISPWTHRPSVDWRETEKQAARNLDQRVLHLDECANFTSSHTGLANPFAAPLSNYQIWGGMQEP